MNIFPHTPGNVKAYQIQETIYSTQKLKYN